MKWAGFQNPQAIEIVIPDSGPLISFAKSNALDLLLIFKNNVRIVITDFVEFEVSRFKNKFPDAQRIVDFIMKNAGRVEIQETSFGKAMKQAVLLREQYDQNENFRLMMQSQGFEPASPAKDSGELSITSFVNELVKFPPGTPVLILAEDDFFLNSGAATPGNAHILSTRAFLNTLQSLDLIPDAKAIWTAMQSGREVNPDIVDRKASKIDTGWTDAIDPDKADGFRCDGSMRRQ